MIRFQREVVEEEGCAYWDARAAMVDKMLLEIGYHTRHVTTPDLAHLTGRGRKGLVTRWQMY